MSKNLIVRAFHRSQYCLVKKEEVAYIIPPKIALRSHKEAKVTTMKPLLSELFRFSMLISIFLTYNRMYANWKKSVTRRAHLSDGIL